MSRNIIAILRGIRVGEVLEIGRALVEAGITRVEVPLNSPDPLASIGALAEDLRGRAQVGAGTVLTEAQVAAVKAAGGAMIVSPDCNAGVIRASKAAGMASYPGVATPSECFAALRHGADGLKLFPSFLIGPEGLAAIRAVLPEGTETYAVGGVGPGSFAEWLQAGVTGFGVGSNLYTPGLDADEVRRRAEEIVAAYDAAAEVLKWPASGPQTG